MTDEHDSQEQSPFTSVGLLAMVGLVLGIGLGVVGAVLLRSPTPAPVDDWTPTTVDLSGESAEAADAFVEAWERSRRGTFVTISEIRRTTAGGGELGLTLVVAQRPPDVVRSSGGSVTGTFDGLRLGCDADPDGELLCLGTEDLGAEHETRVEREIEILRTYVEGERPLYRVAQDGACFDLRLTRQMFAPPYGTTARFCFDPATGAHGDMRISRAEATDVVTLVSASGTATEDDLLAVAEGRYLAADTP
ncbi:MAG: hypothetical protein ACXIVQ_15960 [Acidimicrobiales bacterium]